MGLGIALGPMIGIVIAVLMSVMTRDEPK